MRKYTYETRAYITIDADSETEATRMLYRAMADIDKLIERSLDIKDIRLAASFASLSRDRQRQYLVFLDKSIGE